MFLTCNDCPKSAIFLKNLCIHISKPVRSLGSLYVTIDQCDYAYGHCVHCYLTYMNVQEELFYCPRLCLSIDISLQAPECYSLCSSFLHNDLALCVVVYLETALLQLR